jgi:hypothetical protein
MKKRRFLLATALTAGGMLPATSTAVADTVGPVLLTIGGAITRGNRGPVDSTRDQLLVRHGVKFSNALALDSRTLHSLPKVEIKPTLEYDNQQHKLSGPLLAAVLAAAGIAPGSSVQIGLRAIDGYNVAISLTDIESYRMIIATHLDDQPLSLGGLGPHWAVYDADSLPAFRDKPVKERFALCPWGLYYIDVVPA